MDQNDEAEMSLKEFLSNMFNYADLSYSDLQEEENNKMFLFLIIVILLGFGNWVAVNSDYFEIFFWILIWIDFISIATAIILLIQFFKIRGYKARALETVE